MTVVTSGVMRGRCEGGMGTRRGALCRSVCVGASTRMDIMIYHTFAVWLYPVTHGPKWTSQVRVVKSMHGINVHEWFTGLSMIPVEYKDG